MATVLVTATLNDPSGALLQGNAFVRFKLRNFAGFVPRVSGTSIVCETQIDAVPSAGLISQALWGNNSISPANTFYTIEFWNGGRITSSGNYVINGATALNTAAQANAPQVPSGFLLVLQNNGAMNSSQQLLNIESSDSSVVITDMGAGTINLQAAVAAIPPIGINNQTVTTYPAILTDANTLVRMSTASTVANNFVVPADATVLFPLGSSIFIRQVAAGTTTVIPAAGVTITGPGSSLALRAQYASAQVVRVATNTWDAIGDFVGV